MDVRFDQTGAGKAPARIIVSAATAKSLSIATIFPPATPMSTGSPGKPLASRTLRTIRSKCCNLLKGLATRRPTAVKYTDYNGGDNAFRNGSGG
jgi:hypothetical protein